jgi:copper chaperone
MAKLMLTVPDMACSACAETITKAVHEVDMSASVEANPETKAVVIDSSAADADLKQAIADAGYTVS